MKTSSIEPVFAVINIPHASKPKMPDATALYEAGCSLAFDTFYDTLRHTVLSMIRSGRTAEAIRMLESLDAMIESSGTEAGLMNDVHPAVKQVLAATLLEDDQQERALAVAADTLQLLSANPKRKDEPFMIILASVLYDLALIHSGRDEYRQAERELEKAMRILEKLARTNAERYGSPHIMAINATTTVYRNRERQAEMLAQHQSATDEYLTQVRSGVTDATGRLVDSLEAEGDTLSRMGRHREAVMYFTRALKLLTAMNPATTLRSLHLSISLGDAMLHLEPMRDKAIHLLNTMLHKATKLNAEAEHRNIVNILAESRTRRLDILTLWHKIFPR